MIRRIVVALLMLGCAGAAVVRAQNLSSAQLAISSAMQSGAARFSVVPFNFDPNETDLVRARWLTGTGCPSAVTYVPYGGTTPVTYVEPGCPVGDPKDNEHEGLLLVKTGPTDNFVSAGAKLEGVKGTVLTELGYDIRKPGADHTDPRGSHCGAGAPRFDIFVGD